MPWGCLRSTLEQASADDSLLQCLWNGGGHSASSHAATSFLASSDAEILRPRRLTQSLRHKARLGVSFTAQPGEEEAAENGEANADPNQPAPAPSTEDPNEAAGDGKKEGGAMFPWVNTAGLPIVTTTSKNDKYFSPDIATGEGDGTFKPTFGCKCGDWQPAPTHPIIQFRDSFIAGHPKFTRNVRKLKVHMEDVSMNPPKVHWDATYDLKSFLNSEDSAKAMTPGGAVKLKDTYPAEKGTGEQLRFMTFCPPEPSPGDADHAPGEPVPHEYSLKVTALDVDEQPVDGFVDEESRYSASPPEPEPQPQPAVPEAPGVQKPQPIVATAQA